MGGSNIGHLLLVFFSVFTLQNTVIYIWFNVYEFYDIAVTLVT